MSKRVLRSPSQSPPRPSRNLREVSYAQLRSNMLLEASLDACSIPCCVDTSQKPKSTRQRRAYNRTASFIRAHDLDLTDEDLAQCCEDYLTIDGQKTTITESTSSTSTTGSMTKNKDVLSLNGSGSGAIMSALVIIGIQEATDESARWVATSNTDKILKKRAKQYKKSNSVSSQASSNNIIIIMGPWINAASGTDVFIWSSKCTRPGHGSDYPVVKSRGLIPASAQDVIELIKDSDRVCDYNKMSIGREDEHILTPDVKNSSIHSLDTKCPTIGVPGEAKIMSSKSHPPLTRKPLEFKTLFYARQLDRERDGIELDDVAYITVGRSVWETSEATADGAADTSTTRCEILLSVNLVREIKTGNNGEQKWCELTNITHGVSPGIPIFIGKQVALTAAENYVKDIRAVFEKKK